MCSLFLIDDVIDYYCVNHARAGLLMFMHKSVVVLNLCVHINYMCVHIYTISGVSRI